METAGNFDTCVVTIGDPLWPALPAGERASGRRVAINPMRGAGVTGDWPSRARGELWSAPIGGVVPWAAPDSEQGAASHLRASAMASNGGEAMGVEFSAERRLLAEDELDPVRRSHYPELKQRTHAELVELARFLRARRNRAGDLINNLRRARRGKGGVGEGLASERGLAAKKQVYARALKRVNARIQTVQPLRDGAGATGGDGLGY